VKFGDIYVNKDRISMEIKAISVTFNKVKGVKGDANLRRTVEFNREVSNMYFIEAFRKYLKKDYEIDLDYFNETARKDLKNQLIWIITRQAFTLMVSKSAE
jgi:phosphopantetheine adenylyltransferase